PRSPTVSANASTARNNAHPSLDDRDIVFIDGVRTPFGKAGEKGIYHGTRADDLAVKAVRGLLERNPEVPAEKIDEISIAATTQSGDQGLTLGRTVGLLSGIPKSVPGFA